MGKRRNEIDVSVRVGGYGEDHFTSGELSPTCGMNQCPLGGLPDTVDRAVDEDGPWL